jgi:dehydrogenase/reductase SDR family protein 12
MRTYRSLAARAFDTAAEAFVVPGFSRVGIALRRRLERWGDPPSMAGEVVVVTGATSGIGLAAATAVAGLGATVHLVGRDGERGREAKARVEAAGQAEAQLDLVDMGDTDEVVAFGGRLLERYDRLSALVHNAGALSRRYHRNAAGVESTVATQVLGPYALTATVAPLLCQPTPGRIVTVSSGGMYTQRFDLGALEMQEDGYDGVVAYARVKRAQVVLADAWAAHFARAGVASYAMHPGWVDTPGLQAGMPGFRALWRLLLRTPAEGADTVVWLAAAGAAAAGAAAAGAAATGSAATRPMAPGPGGRDGRGSLSGLFHDRRRRSDHRLGLTRPTRPGDGEALMAWCAGRTGVKMPVMGVAEK